MRASLGVLAAACWVLAAVSDAASTPEPEFSAGSAFTAGSRGYRRLSFTGDARWEFKSVEPFGWADIGLGNRSRGIAFGGGAWKDIDSRLSAKGGLGLGVGKLKDSEQNYREVLLEAGLEKAYGARALGAEYRLAAGSVGEPGAGNLQRPSPGNGRGRGFSSGQEVPGSEEHYTFNEVAAYGRLLAGRLRMTLRLGVGYPSYSRPVYMESLRASVLASRNVRVSGSLAFEQGVYSDVYAGAGLSVTFD